MGKIVEESIYIPYANHHRTIRIYLPDLAPSKRYPVIYMHDGQNLFDEKTSSYGYIWEIDKHLENHYNKTKQAFIVVGIDNWQGGHHRLDEYSPWVNTTIKKGLLSDITSDVGGLGDSYLDFMVKTLKPYIDDHYPTLKDYENTGIIGSSMGGLISLYAGLKYPNVFSKIGAFSTAVWFAEQALIHLIKDEVNQNSKWYLDVGTHESSNPDQESFSALYVEGTKNVYSHLLAKTEKSQVQLVIDEGGIHNEKYWSKRFPQALAYLFK